MEKEKALSFVSGHSRPIGASVEQDVYLNAGNYDVADSEGKTFITRMRKFLAINPLSGNILIQEKTSCKGHDYEKILVISPDGKPEKFRGDNF